MSPFSVPYHYPPTPKQWIVPPSQPKMSTSDVEIALLLLYLCVSEPYASPDRSVKTENCRWKWTRGKGGYDCHTGDDFHSAGDLGEISFQHLHPTLIPLFPPVCEGRRPGDGEEGVYDSVDQDGQVLLAGITKLQKGDRTKNVNFTLALQEWNHGRFNRAFPYGAPCLAWKSWGLRRKVTLNLSWIVLAISFSLFQLLWMLSCCSTRALVFGVLTEMMKQEALQPGFHGFTELVILKVNNLFEPQSYFISSIDNQGTYSSYGCRCCKLTRTRRRMSWELQKLVPPPWLGFSPLRWWSGCSTPLLRRATSLSTKLPSRCWRSLWSVRLPILLSPICLSWCQDFWRCIQLLPHSAIFQDVQNIHTFLLQAYDNVESSVRKAAVFCIVSLHQLVIQNQILLLL